MTTKVTNFNKNVFINCPFDEEYVPLLRPLLFTVLRCGLEPRISLESFDSGRTRLNMICRLISASKYSIHDLSRAQAQEADEIYRMNMPFELGLDIGCRRFGSGSKRRKLCLILEQERYRYQQALSDISGSDIKNHGNNPEDIALQTRNWFVECGHKRLPSGQRIWEEFNEFMADFFVRRKDEGFSDRELQMMPIPELISFMREWIFSR